MAATNYTKNVNAVGRMVVRMSGEELLWIDRTAASLGCTRAHVVRLLIRQGMVGGFDTDGVSSDKVGEA